MTTQVVTDEELGQLARKQHDLFRRVREGGVEFLTVMDGLQLLIEGYEILSSRRFGPKPTDTTDSQLQSWYSFYQKYFGLELDIASAFKIPERKPGFDQLIVVSKGITLNQIIEVCRKEFQVWVYTKDLNSNVTENDRTNIESYAIWVRDRVEADEENKNLSANDCKAKNIQGETLMEALLHHLKYFSETDKHLDVKNITLCSGSRDRDRGVLGVDWGPGHRELCVAQYNPANRDGNLRVRSVVS